MGEASQAEWRVMSTSRFDGDRSRKTKLFDSTVIREAQEGMEFMANVLEASTAYSIIGQDLEGNILLWNEGARRMYGYGQGSTFTLVLPTLQ